MNTTAAPVSPPDQPPFAGALRRLSSEMRGGDDPRNLIVALDGALTLMPGLSHSRVEPLDGPARFSTDALSFPVLGTSGAVGLLRVGQPGGEPFGREQLRLATAVAEFASTVVTNAGRARQQALVIELLSVALDTVGEGIACFDTEGKLVFANARTREFLGGAAPEQWAEIWTRHAPASRAEPGTSFVRQVGERVLHVVARRNAKDNFGAVVITDLSPRIAGSKDAIAGETYRAIATNQRLCLAVLSGSEGSTDALDLLEKHRAALPPGTRIGPVDADSAVVIAPGLELNALARSLLPIGEQAQKAGLRGGSAALQGAGDSPEGLLARATASLQPLLARGRVDILVLDRSPVVGDALSLMLSKDCAVTCVNRWEQGLDLLAKKSFDGLILELPPTWDPSAAERLRQAMQLQPSARPFFITDLPGPWNLAELGLPTAPVFRKPFQVGEVRDTLKSAFEEKAFRLGA